MESFRRGNFSRAESRRRCHRANKLQQANLRLEEERNCSVSAAHALPQNLNYVPNSAVRDINNRQSFHQNDQMSRQMFRSELQQSTNPVIQSNIGLQSNSKQQLDKKHEYAVPRNVVVVPGKGLVSYSTSKDTRPLRNTDIEPYKKSSYPFFME